MWYMIKISWKNVWRNPVRSGVVVTAIFLGIWAGVFISAFSNGMVIQRMNDQLNTYTGHIQIHNPAFINDKKIGDLIPDPDSVMDVVKKTTGVTGVVHHTIAIGLASSSTNSYGVMINGVNSKQESSVLNLPHKVVEGKFLEGISRYPVVIGKVLANRLNVHLHSKIVLTFQDTTGNITASAFRIAGIYETTNRTYDESNVFVRASDLNALIGTTGLVNEIVIKVDDPANAQHITDELAPKFPNLKVQSWQQVAPEIQFLNDSMNLSIYIFMGILILALALGIINTMLMAIMERTRELGMLMAVGMSKNRLFSMIVGETFFLSFVGAPIGIFLSWITISLTGHFGINLGFLSKGLTQFGYGYMIYPSLHPSYYLTITLMMMIAALLASIYPAWKALRLKPIQAIRKI